MKSKIAIATPKAPTGIEGFDIMTRGGLPQGRTTLLQGGPGSGKTMLAMQFLVHGAQVEKETGIFVAFEEAPDRIVANVQNFGWELDKLRRDKLFFIDARVSPSMVQAGDIDLGGILAAVGAKAKEVGARRIVFDALDIYLTLMPDDQARRRETYQLNEWLLQHEITGLITAKVERDVTGDSCGPLDIMQFMVDCSVLLSHRVNLGVSQRNIRIQKYRGSGFEENESPFVIGPRGFDVAIARTSELVNLAVSDERISTGVTRLDTMLGGGYYRGASILITGAPGTAKTTLVGAFAEAACQRGEQTIFFNFDADGKEVIRNLASVGIQLAQHVDSGLLQMVSARTLSGRRKLFSRTSRRCRKSIMPVASWSIPSLLWPEPVTS